MDLENALEYLRQVKMLGFRAGEIEIPTVEIREHACEVPDGENFSELLENNAKSVYQSLLFSDFIYSQKGAFAFSAISSELAKNAKIKLKKGKDAKVFRFGKVQRIHWTEKIESAVYGKELDNIYREIARRCERGKETRFIVCADGKTILCYMKFGTVWKKLFSLPFKQGIFPIHENRFIIAYALGVNLYGGKEFNPSFGNIIFGATPDWEYGWLEEGFEVGDILANTEEIRSIYSKEYGLDDMGYFNDFLLFSLLINQGAYAEINGKKYCTPELFANIPYMLARAEERKKNGDFNEALFFLRTCTEFALLALRTAPLSGKMSGLTKYFDECENIASQRFVIEKNIIKTFDFIPAEKLKKGKHYLIHEGKTFMEFGTLAMIIHSIFSSAPEKMLNYINFWKELKFGDAILFIASYAKQPVIELLEKECNITRGSDLIKMDIFGSKMLIKRAMVYESGNAEEIKTHLVKMIEIAEKRSIDEMSKIDEIGSFGEAVYEIVKNEKTKALAFVSAKRFY